MADPTLGEIPERWEFTTLGDVTKRTNGVIQTGPFGSQLHASDYVPLGIPSIMPVNIGDNRIIENGIARITEEDASRLSRHRVRAGDIVYSRRGDVERRSLVREKEEGWLCGTGCLMVRFGNGSIDPLFASFYLGHPAVRAWIVRHAVGATMPNLNTKIMQSLPFVVPPLAEQKTIAGILGTLDDKIELNRRMNETLEAMARAIFKSWFVDFDPVRARLDGRHPPGMDANTAALFPDRFEHTELGLVPKAWPILPVGEVVEAVGGGTPSTKEPSFWDGGTHHWATPKDFSKLDAPLLLDTDRKVTEAGLEKISSGLLPQGTLLLSSRAPVGYLAISEIPVAVNQGFIAMKCNGDVSSFYMLNWCRENMDEIERRASGTTFQEISKRNFRPIPMAVPQRALVVAFDDAVGSMYCLIGVNLRESKTLAATRDALLPKLLSGELRVRDAKQGVEEAV
ncbi:MAG: restriction endonuclease subunit S [Planctomycetes bacterium]|nr:restriction endonuclease subunit S [Planctomycetota bacterium]